MKTTIVWFRKDLRIADHPPLMHAIKEGKVVPLFIWNPEEEGEWPLGGASKWWLHHSLKSLEKQLASLNLKLIIRKGKSLDVIQSVMKETGASQVVWSRRYEPASIARDTEIKAAISGCKSFKSNLLLEPWELKKLYKVYTPFYKYCLTLKEPELPLPSPKNAEGVSAESLKIEDLELLPRIHWDAEIDAMWNPGTAEAEKRLHEFRPENYSKLRDRPDLLGVSKLSPALHFGELSPRQIYHHVRGKEGAESYIRQLYWREFAHHLLYHFPKTPTEALREDWKNFPWKVNPEELEKWQKGQTGYPIVDAGMRELWHTGWMHNRVRMIVGSFLVKDLLISWVEGARWFWDTLLDADLANNTFGWQWVGGCGADAAPYFRIFNPTLQGQKFDPEGDYVRKWIPELKHLSKDVIHEPWKIGGVKGYPERMVDHDVARKRALSYKQEHSTSLE